MSATFMGVADGARGAHNSTCQIKAFHCIAIDDAAKTRPPRHAKPLVTNPGAWIVAGVFNCRGDFRLEHHVDPATPFAARPSRQSAVGSQRGCRLENPRDLAPVARARGRP